MMMEYGLFPVRELADNVMNNILVGTKSEKAEDLVVEHDWDIRPVFFFRFWEEDFYCSPQGVEVTCQKG